MGGECCVGVGVVGVSGVWVGSAGSFAGVSIELLSSLLLKTAAAADSHVGTAGILLGGVEVVGVGPGRVLLSSRLRSLLSLLLLLSSLLLKTNATADSQVGSVGLTIIWISFSAAAGVFLMLHACVKKRVASSVVP